MKLDFAKGPIGRSVAKFMWLEHMHIGEWKTERIVEAAGPSFDATSARSALVAAAATAPAVLFSFTDCPWCLLAKEALHSELAAAKEYRTTASPKVASHQGSTRQGSPESHSRAMP